VLHDFGNLIPGSSPRRHSSGRLIRAGHADDGRWTEASPQDMVVEFKWHLRSPSFNKLIFHFEIAATFSLSPLLFSVDLCNLSECSSYSQVPFRPEKMTSYSEEQAKINSYFCCKFPHCQRYFSTELGLKIHRNRLHPDWNSDEGWLVILLLEICPHNNSRSPPAPLHNVF